MAVIDLLYKTKADKQSMYTITQDGGRFERVKTDTQSDRLNQDFYVAAAELWAQCTPHEWYVVGRIASELKSNNALWVCDRKLKDNGTTKKAIAGLVRLNVLIKTETTHIYLVNPFYIRRGEFFTVLNTTASLLMDASHVTTDHVVARVPVKAMDSSYYLLLGPEERVLK